MAKTKKSTKNNDGEYTPKMAIWSRKSEESGVEYLTLKTLSGEYVPFFKTKNKKPGDKKPDYYQGSI